MGEVEVGESYVWEFEASLGYTRPCMIEKKKPEEEVGISADPVWFDIGASLGSPD